MSEIPVIGDLGEEFLNEAEKGPATLSGGWYRAIVTKAEAQVSKQNDKFGQPKLTLMTKLTLNMLTDEDSAESKVPKARVTKLVCYSIPHPELPPAVSKEHEQARRSARSTISENMIRDVRSCFGPDMMPYFPRQELGTWKFKGEDIGEEEVEEKRRELRRTAPITGKKLFNNPEEYVNCAPYVKLDPSKDFPIVAMAHELPGEAVLVDPEDWWVS